MRAGNRFGRWVGAADLRPISTGNPVLTEASTFLPNKIVKQSAFEFGVFSAWQGRTGGEQKWTDAYKNQDIALMNTFLADDVVVTVEDGAIYGKSDWSTVTTPTGKK